MQASLYQMSLSLISKAFTFILLFAAAETIAQNTIVTIDVSGLKGKPVRYSFPKGAVMRSDIPRFKAGDENGKVIINKEVTKIELLQLSYGDAYKDIILQPGDSLKLFWSKEHKSFEFERSSDLNQKIDSLNSTVNQWFLKLAYLRNSTSANEFIRAKTDSLRRESLANTGRFLSIYQWYAAADLDFMVNPMKMNSLKSFYFKNRSIYPMHPAWIFSFNSFFGGEILKKLNETSGSTLRKSIEDERWQEIEALFMQDTSINDTALVKWVVLKGMYELSNVKDFQIKKLYSVLSDGLKIHKADSSFSIEVEAILKKWKPQITGNSFPDFKVNSYQLEKKDKLLKELTNKPIYLSYLPDRSVNSILLLKELAALQKKFGNEIHFVVFIPDLSEKDELYIDKGYQGLQFLELEYSEDALRELFPDSDQAGFALIDRYYNTYSFPAEGPETGVENSFLGLIKK